MGVDSANAQHGARMRLGSVWLPLLLCVVVIAAAGLAGRTHFGGIRLHAHLSGQARTGKPGSAPLQPSPNAAAHTNQSSSWTVYVIVFALVVVFALVAYVMIRLWLSRRAPAAKGFEAAGAVPHVATAEPVPEPELLVTGIEIALQALDDERDPADAIVRAWLGLEGTAEESGIRRGSSETPTEFTARIMRSAFADDQAVRTLLRLYLRTRFGDHPPTAADVADVRAALQQLVSNWHNSPRGRLARSR